MPSACSNIKFRPPKLFISLPKRQQKRTTICSPPFLVFVSSFMHTHSLYLYSRLRFMYNSHFVLLPFFNIFIESLLSQVPVKRATVMVLTRFKLIMGLLTLMHTFFRWERSFFHSQIVGYWSLIHDKRVEIFPKQWWDPKTKVLLLIKISSNLK